MNETRSNVGTNKATGLMIWAAGVAFTTVLFNSVGWDSSKALNAIGVDMSLWSIVFAVMVVVNWGFPANPRTAKRILPTILMFAVGIAGAFILYYAQFAAYGEPVPALSATGLMSINISLCVMVSQFIFLALGK